MAAEGRVGTVRFWWVCGALWKRKARNLAEALAGTRRKEKPVDRQAVLREVSDAIREVERRAGKLDEASTAYAPGASRTSLGGQAQGMREAAAVMRRAYARVKAGWEDGS